MVHLIGTTLMLHKIELWREKSHSGIWHIICRCSDGTDRSKNVLDFPLNVAFADDGYFVLSPLSSVVEHGQIGPTKLLMLGVTE